MTYSPVENFTPQQQKFINYIVQGNSQTDSARMAGYKHPAQQAWALLRDSRVQNAIFEAQKQRLSTNLLSKSLKVIEEILDDGECNRALRFKAAAYVTDKALELQAMATARDIAEKSPLEMTAAELEIFVMRGRIIVEKEKAKEDLGLVVDHTG